MINRYQSVVEILTSVSIIGLIVADVRRVAK